MHELVAGDVAALKEAADRWRPMTGRGPGTPLARTKFDQATHGQNPFWEIVRWMPADEWKGRWSPLPAFMTGDAEILATTMRRGLEMRALQRRFSWSIPAPADLTWAAGLLDGRGVVEVGAGTGYWAWMLEQHQVDVRAYDLCPPGEENRYCDGGPYAEVRHGGPEAAAEHADRALLLSWPPGESDMASRTLASYGGDLVFFAGEYNVDVVANAAFYKMLATEWEPVSEAPGHVTWWGMHCRLTAWRRAAPAG